MSSAGPSRSPQPSSRFHPYTLHPHNHPHPSHHAENHRTKSRRPDRSPARSAKGEYPPSPPRSGRDASETPSVSLSMAFGGISGGKWWDEELPPPPASLASILESFRKSGEGDRELLLSILGAKKAEEERLSAMIHTRLTVLQARLSLHQAAAVGAMPLPVMPVPPPADLAMSNTSPNPQQPPGPRSEDLGRSPERTPSLTSRDSGRSSSAGVASPPAQTASEFMPPPPRPVAHAYGQGYEKDREDPRPRFWQLHPNPASRVPLRPSGQDLPPLREAAEGLNKERSRGGSRSISPKDNGMGAGVGRDGRDRSGSGLEMLLDVGMRGLESEQRA
ncbi:hypothetical protein I307_00202 [Cryptococcus deuterogattii 99/473]|uniref:Uncharacterized protein n=2 Tax=Cryptococcus deuterogattii TaxID=1859096 RepID=A0A0D0V8C9_9TREE|nr:hypothetical protein CNBG_3146 [Cryptococcus deuterogattii R265]KIR43756.1 hypothetical protein I313_00601 [Cryptococcus deuterogattii Ram5]KIR75088.1 hypothetical protein I310_01365 [Cryptococcus deuterogattii CA1014]KIR98079.1 hypothetical protein L804_04540 [Cryptococcus deuterogattii 2001/935-1]KIY60402.1 hypothetical protein I307_00202 [Cryptococcus deuterogattii 99/473]